MLQSHFQPLPRLIITALLMSATLYSQKPTAAAAVPSSESLDWTNYRGGASLHGCAAGSLGDQLRLAWTFKTGDAIVSSPVAADGLVYFGSSDQHVYAVDIASGKQKWSFKTDDLLDAPPLVYDGRVYIGSSDFFFYALDAKTGKLSWKFETGDKILGGANLVKTSDGRTLVVVGSYDCKLYCFDPASGKKIWVYETANYLNATPAVSGDRIIFGGCDAILHVVSGTTGKAVAKVELGQECHVASAPAIADDKVFMGHYGNEFICVDLKTNKQLWKYVNRQQPFFSSPSLAEDRVVFGGRDKWLHCVKRSDGSRLWTFPTRRKIDGSPVICGDKVVFGSGDGRIYMLSLKDGTLIAKYEIGRPIFSSPAVMDGMVLIGSNDGLLYAFHTKPPAKVKEQAGEGGKR